MSQHRVSPWAVAHLQRLGQLPLAQLEAGLVGGAVQQLPLLPPHDVHHVAVPAQRLGAAPQNVVVCQKLICCLARSLHIESTMSRYRLCALALRHRKVKASNYSTRPAYHPPCRCTSSAPWRCATGNVKLSHPKALFSQTAYRHATVTLHRLGTLTLRQNVRNVRCAIVQRTVQTRYSVCWIQQHSVWQWILYVRFKTQPELPERAHRPRLHSDYVIPMARREASADWNTAMWAPAAAA